MKEVLWLKVQKPLPIPSLKIVGIKYTDTVPFSPDGTYNGDNHAFVMKIGNDTPVEIGSDGNGNDMLELYVVVTIPRGSPDRMTADLIGPIVVNNRTREAVQMVIADSPYSHKFPLIAKRQEHSGAPDQNEVTEPVSGGKTAGESPP